MHFRIVPAPGVPGRCRRRYINRRVMPACCRRARHASVTVAWSHSRMSSVRKRGVRDGRSPGCTTPPLLQHPLPACVGGVNTTNSREGRCRGRGDVGSACDRLRAPPVEIEALWRPIRVRTHRARSDEGAPDRIRVERRRTVTDVELDSIGRTIRSDATTRQSTTRRRLCACIHRPRASGGTTPRRRGAVRRARARARADAAMRSARGGALDVDMSDSHDRDVVSDVSS
jgi:hypothetical protein